MKIGDEYGDALHDLVLAVQLGSKSAEEELLRQAYGQIDLDVLDAVERYFTQRVDADQANGRQPDGRDVMAALTCAIVRAEVRRREGS